MQSPEKIIDEMRGLMDQIEAVLRPHEIAKHGGENCWANRVSALAYVAHRLGFRAGNCFVPQLLGCLLEYERLCPN